jgi:hypothetical protein
LRIEGYFLRIHKIVESSPVVHLSNVTYEKRGTHEGIIRGQVEFVDSSVLFWREYVDVEIKEDRLMYVYQYMDSYKKLIFRYDNTGHHKKLGLPTYPNHKHEGREDNVVSSRAMNLANVLEEIESMIQLP